MDLPCIAQRGCYLLYFSGNLLWSPQRSSPAWTRDHYNIELFAVLFQENHNQHSYKRRSGASHTPTMRRWQEQGDCVRALDWQTQEDTENSPQWAGYLSQIIWPKFKFNFRMQIWTFYFCYCVFINFEFSTFENIIERVKEEKSVEECDHPSLNVCFNVTNKLWLTSVTYVGTNLLTHYVLYI